MTNDEIENALGPDAVRFSPAGARCAVTEASLAAMQEATTSILGAFHGENPEQAGIPEEKLRRVLAQRYPVPVFTALVGLLADRQAIVISSGFVRLPDHSPSLGAADEKLWERIRSLIAGAPYHPPTVRELSMAMDVQVADTRRLCKVLAAIGELVEVAHNRYFLPTALDEMISMARDLAVASQSQTFTAAEFKDRAGCGRTLGIKVLEYFDRRGVTTRVGDVRRVARLGLGSSSEAEAT